MLALLGAVAMCHGVKAHMIGFLHHPLIVGLALLVSLIGIALVRLGHLPNIAIVIGGVLCLLMRSRANARRYNTNNGFFL